MRAMFYYVSNFTSDLSSWDVDQVTDMTTMVLGAAQFNSDLSSWDVSKVNSFHEMFSQASAMDHDLCAWGPRMKQDVAVTCMFGGCHA